MNIFKTIMKLMQCRQKTNLVNIFFIVLSFFLGVSDVSMLYIIYQDKKIAQDFFNGNEKLRNKAHFIEFGEMKKEYPQSFLLKENLHFIVEDAEQ